MKPEFTYLFDDLPGVAATVTSLLPGAESCTIHHRGDSVIEWLRLPGGFLCVHENRMEQPIVGAVEALGRMVAYQTLDQCDYAPGLIHDLVESASGAGSELDCGERADVNVSPPRTEKGITEYKLQLSGHTAVVLASHDQGLPLATVIFSKGMPPRALTREIGHTLLSHHQLLMGCPLKIDASHKTWK